MQLSVHRNEAGAEPKELRINPAISFSKFKKIIGKAVDVRVQRVFLASGAELAATDEIRERDFVYCSSGEPFYKDTRHGLDLHLAVLGSGGVGKSAITLRFVRDLFIQDWDPTIEDAYRKPLIVDGQLCNLDILDTAGQDDFESMRPQWMSNRDGYVFVYSVDSKDSLEELQAFFDLHLEINEHKEVPIVLVGNKIDLVEAKTHLREVTVKEGRERAEAYKACFVEASAQTGENVSLVFETFIRQARRLSKPKDPPKRRFFCSLV